MNIQQKANVLFQAMLVASTGFGIWLGAATPGHALDDKHQLLTGGTSIADGTTHFVSPGTQANYFAEGLGQIRMPAGVLKSLKVKLKTTTVPTSGSFSLTVRKNGLNTILTCSLTATGNCNAPGPVAFANNDRLAVRVSSSFVNASTSAYTYTLLFD